MWCHKERQSFIRHAGGKGSLDGRIYLINYGGIEPRNLPEEINRFTPYQFYEVDRETENMLPAALLSEHAGRFHKELYSLRHDLIEAFLHLDAPAVKGSQMTDTEPGGDVRSDESLPR